MRTLIVFLIFFGSVAADGLDPWIAPPLPLKEGFIRQVDQTVMLHGFSGEEAKQEALAIQEKRAFPIGRLLLFIAFYAALAIIYSRRAQIESYFRKPPPTPEELAREKLLLWEKTPPQTPEEFSARYAALTDLARSRFNLPLSLSAQEFVAHVNRTEIAALFEKAQKAKFAHIPPTPAEYQADLLTVKSLYWSS